MEADMDLVEGFSSLTYFPVTHISCYPNNKQKTDNGT